MRMILTNALFFFAHKTCSTVSYLRVHLIEWSSTCTDSHYLRCTESHITYIFYHLMHLQASPHGDQRMHCATVEKASTSQCISNAINYHKEKSPSRPYTYTYTSSPIASACMLPTLHYNGHSIFSQPRRNANTYCVPVSDMMLICRLKMYNATVWFSFTCASIFFCAYKWVCHMYSKAISGMQLPHITNEESILFFIRNIKRQYLIHNKTNVLNVIFLENLGIYSPNGPSELNFFM